jgi:hypothetical protein
MTYHFLGSFFFIFCWIFYGIQCAALDLGYVQNVQAEKQEKYYEIFLFAEPPPKPLVSLQDKIFSAELTKEFRRKYIEQFGTVDTDSLNYTDPTYAGFGDDNSHLQSTADQASLDARAAYGQYMVKRLAEWHVDHWIKDDPQMRPIYEAKEKLSKTEVKLNADTKMEAQYDLSANTLEVKFFNPYIDSKVIMYMDPSAFGPSNNTENKLFLGKQINSKYRVNVTATSNDGIGTFEIVRKLRGNMSTNILSSTFFKDQGITVRQTSTVVGLSNTF